MANETKSTKCADWPHPMTYGKDACPLDRAQYLRESRRRQTTSEQREAMRQAAHEAKDVSAAEDAADEVG